MKRGIIAVVLVLSMLLTSVAFAEGTPKLALGEFPAVNAGATKIVDLAFDQAVEMAGFSIELTFDSATFEVESFEFDSSLASWNKDYKAADGKLTVFGAVKGDTPVEKIGLVHIATKPGAGVGNYPIELKATLLDAGLNKVAANTESTTATVKVATGSDNTNSNAGIVSTPTPKDDSKDNNKADDNKTEGDKTEGDKTEGDKTEGDKTEVTAPSFTDIDESHWAYASVVELAGLGVVQGVEEGVFAPDQNVTRAQFVKMLVVGLGLDGQDGTCDYTDVAEGDWFYSYVAAATKNGIVKGNDAGEFEPNKEISRQDMAVMVYRAGTMKGLLEAPAEASLSFADADAVAAYANEAVAALVEKGIINGVGDNMFDPNGTATRAMASKVIADLI